MVGLQSYVAKVEFLRINSNSSWILHISILMDNFAFMKQDNNKEIFPVVDECGNVVGKATRGECHGGSMLLHPVVHLHLFDSSGRIYLQQRPLWKDIQPGKWDTAVGGHIDYGEMVEEALLRETREELGLTGLSVTFLLKYVFESERERELVQKAGRPSIDFPDLPLSSYICTNSISSLSTNLFNTFFCPSSEKPSTCISVETRTYITHLFPSLFISVLLSFNIHYVKFNCLAYFCITSAKTFIKLFCFSLSSWVSCEVLYIFFSLTIYLSFSSLI